MLTKGGRRVTGQPRVIERLTINGDRYDVTPGPYAGRFSLRSGQVVEITSRFAFPDLVRLAVPWKKKSRISSRLGSFAGLSLTAHVPSVVGAPGPCGVASGVTHRANGSATISYRGATLRRPEAGPSPTAPDQ